MYVIAVALESPDRKTQYDTAPLFIEELEPGQTKAEQGNFLAVQHLPTGAVVKLKSVQRDGADQPSCW
jgi:hypothetical protein